MKLQVSFLQKYNIGSYPTAWRVPKLCVENSAFRNECYLRIYLVKRRALGVVMLNTPHRMLLA